VPYLTPALTAISDYISSGAVGVPGEPREGSQRDVLYIEGSNFLETRPKLDGLIPSMHEVYMMMMLLGLS
jgi:hypothetical protein